MKNREFKNGEVYLGYVRFSEAPNSKGKMRPVVIFQDPEDNRLYACKVSTRVEKPIARRIGYFLQDWADAGLNAPSYVSCEKENVRIIDPKSIHKYIGQLSQRDISGMLIKRIKVLEMEYKKEMNNSLER